MAHSAVKITMKITSISSCKSTIYLLKKKKYLCCQDTLEDEDYLDFFLQIKYLQFLNQAFKM